MTKVKTSDLVGSALNWAVAKCIGIERWDPEKDYKQWPPSNYSGDWAHGGPIIDKEHITVGYTGLGGTLEINRKPEAYYIETLFDDQEGWHQIGPTPLVAAMRCYVARNLGVLVEIPDELAN